MIKRSSRATGIEAALGWKCLGQKAPIPGSSSTDSVYWEAVKETWISLCLLLKLSSYNLWCPHCPHDDFDSSWKGNDNNKINLLLIEQAGARSEMGGLLIRLSHSSANLLSCLDQKGPSLKVYPSRPCIIFQQFGGKEVTFWLINTSTTCQNQGSPTFPTAWASGMLSVKSWAELFSVLTPLIRCLKWEHFVS